MINSIFIFAVSIFMVVRGATLSTRYSALLAESYNISKYVVGFIVVAVISILPETFISVSSAFSGMPAFGLGVLFGSNIADLTLIFSIIILIANRGLKIESRILQNRTVYPFILLVPLVLGLNGHFSRLEGVALIITGAVFYYLALKNNTGGSVGEVNRKNKLRYGFMLLLSMSILLLGAHFTVVSATSIANYIGISPVLIGMLIVGLGTTMPELLFSIKSVSKNDDSLAVGDILGTVLADATVVVGILAIVSPFYFPRKIIYITGAFMVVASFLLFHFMRSGRSLSKREAWMLFAFWVCFALTEFISNG